MEMMDINENLMELEFGFDQKTFDQVQKDLKLQQTLIYQTNYIPCTSRALNVKAHFVYLGRDHHPYYFASISSLRFN